MIIFADSMPKKRFFIHVLTTTSLNIHTEMSTKVGLLSAVKFYENRSNKLVNATLIPTMQLAHTAVSRLQSS